MRLEICYARRTAVTSYCDQNLTTLFDFSLYTVYLPPEFPTLAQDESEVRKKLAELDELQPKLAESRHQRAVQRKLFCLRFSNVRKRTHDKDVSIVFLQVSSLSPILPSAESILSEPWSP